MKYLLLILLFAFTISCSNEPFNENLTPHLTNNEQEKNKETIHNEVLFEVNFNGLILPENTTYTVSSNAIEFHLPTGYELVGNDENGVSARAGSGELTCNCLKGRGDCTPFKAGDMIGCSTDTSDPCLECKGTISAIINGNPHELSNYFIKTPVDESPFLSFLASVRPMVSMEEWNEAEWITESIYNMHESKIEEILDFVWKGKSKQSERTVHVMLLVYEHKALIEIPYSSLETDNLYTNFSGGGNDGISNVTCSGCDGDCVVRSKKLGSVKYCDGCNSGCTISW